MHEAFEENRSKISGKKSRKRRGASNEQPIVEEEVEDVSANLDDRVIPPGQPSSALNNYVPTSKMKGMEDWVEEDDQLKYLNQSSEFVLKKESDDHLQFPTLLKAFVFPRGDISRFPRPKRSSFGTSSKYLKILFFIAFSYLIFLYRLLLDGCGLFVTCPSLKLRTIGQSFRFMCSTRRKVFGHFADRLPK